MTWLFDHGFTAADIQVERSFELHLGRSVFRVASGRLIGPGDSEPDAERVRRRADVLVRHSTGRNLLIIEVKERGHLLQ